MDKEIIKKTENLLKNYNILESQIKVCDDEKLKEKKETIDIAIDSLNETEKKVIDLKYREKRKYSWNDISKKINFCESYCRYQIKLRALEQIANIVFANEV